MMRTARCSVSHYMYRISVTETPWTYTPPDIDPARHRPLPQTEIPKQGSPGQRPPSKEHRSRHRDPPEGTGDQVARQEVISNRERPPPPQTDKNYKVKFRGAHNDITKIK